MTYVDNNGYLRDGFGMLVHRRIAFQKLRKNRHRYGLPFRAYQVHHKDGNKLNNDPANLEIVTKAEHRQRHNLPGGYTPFRKTTPLTESNWSSRPYRQMPTQRRSSIRGYRAAFNNKQQFSRRRWR